MSNYISTFCHSSSRSPVRFCSVSLVLLLPLPSGPGTNMHLLLSLLAVIPLAAAQAGYYRYGPTYGIRRQTPSPVFIESLSTTLFPGAPPAPATPRLALWPGMDTDGGDLIQPIFVGTRAEYYAQGCTDSAKWCVFSSVYHKTSVLGATQISGDAFMVAGAPNDAVYWEAKYNPQSGEYDQQLEVNGRVVSKISLDSGKAKTFYTGVECQDDHRGVVSSHRYVNTTIILSEANLRWGIPNDVYMTSTPNGAPSSPDGGKTWVIPEILVAESVSPKDFR
ncbi:hypothetical protein K402DRAFT_466428 [Aulographum hederae CBS 113979]|uniref:Concanavalin A-like lectin/glucanase n=1 Tax=Aulographum hederae CBS 113979 TaxID=1176131 RepID=A0A6G1GPV4_9PEZI|nr:hypothetical protein K402DRAFT_466428 [Aulographum hederae CBS 113979]